MSRVRREAEIRFDCRDCGYSSDVEGRWIATGKFEPLDYDDLDCPECGSERYPNEYNIEVEL